MNRRQVNNIINVITLIITLTSGFLIIVLSFFEQANSNLLIRLLGIGLVMLCSLALEKEIVKKKKRKHKQARKVQKMLEVKE